MLRVHDLDLELVDEHARQRRPHSHRAYRTLRAAGRTRTTNAGAILPSRQTPAPATEIGGAGHLPAALLSGPSPPAPLPRKPLRCGGDHFVVLTGRQASCAVNALMVGTRYDRDAGPSTARPASYLGRGRHHRRRSLAGRAVRVAISSAGNMAPPLHDTHQREEPASGGPAPTSRVARPELGGGSRRTAAAPAVGLSAASGSEAHGTASGVTNRAGNHQQRRKSPAQAANSAVTNPRHSLR